MREHYLIGYDITDPRRLGRLYRRLKRYATPIQYSLFLGIMTGPKLSQCVEDIELIIDAKTDDVRIYPLPRNYWSRRSGRAVMPEGIVHTGLPLEWAKIESSPDEAASRDLPAQSIINGGGRRDSLARKMQQAIQTGQKQGFLLIR